MADIISMSISNGSIFYYVDKEHFDLFFSSKEQVDTILNTTFPKNDSEKFVLKVYEKYNSLDLETEGKRLLRCSQEVKFDL